MTKIIFINQEAGPLLIDMVNVFAKKNFDITLYTGQVIKTYVDLDDSVKVRQLCKYEKSNNYKRMLTWCKFFFQVLFFLIKDAEKGSIIWVSTNPPFAPWITILFNRRVFIHVYDVYPNALLAFPWITRDSVIYKVFLWLNKLAFSRAEKLFTPSIGMKDMLTDSVEGGKVEVIPWWADTDFIKPIDKAENAFLLQNGLEDNFVVMYSGNLGLTHNVEKLLNAADALREYEEVKIVIIGDGPKRKIVDDYSHNYEFDNLLVLPFQDENVLPFSLAAADIAIVLDSFASSGKNESTASIPSKTYYLMAAGSIIYAESDSSSELSRLIESYELGLCDSSQEVDGLVAFVKACIEDEDLAAAFRRNSRSASANFTRKNARRLYDAIVE